MRTITLLLLTAGITMMSSFRPSPAFTVTSSAFSEGGNIPARYTCQGENVSPPLHLANIPAGTQSLALIVHDPDAPMQGGFTHWVVWNINVTADIPEQYNMGGQGVNSANEHGYMGMCPPSGTHHYHFKVYALDQRLRVQSQTDKKMLETSMKGHILAEAELVGLYKKP